jgi:hypothetical protein
MKQVGKTRGRRGFGTGQAVKFMRYLYARARLTTNLTT